MAKTNPPNQKVLKPSFALVLGNMIGVCDGCLTAVYDELGAIGREESETVAMNLGSEIPDHICEAREEGNPCSCGCNSG